MIQQSSKGLSQAKVDQAAETLRVLAHPVRLRLIELLTRQRFSVGELAARLKQEPQVVSQHLNQMRVRGLLRRERQGRTVYYQVTDSFTMNVLQCVRQAASESALVSPGGATI